MKYLTLVLSLFLALRGQAQVDWKFQTKHVDDVEHGGNSPYDNNHYLWSEESDLRQGIRLDLKSKDPKTLYLEAGNAHFAFRFKSMNKSINFLGIKIDDNPGMTIKPFSVNGDNEVYWDASDDFTEVGSYTLKVTFYLSFTGSPKTREYKVRVVPPSDELHMDQYGNSMRVWKSEHPNATPFVMSVGLDALNTISEQFQRHDLRRLFECMMDDETLPHDIYILYYRYNPQHLRNNSAVFFSAVKYVSNDLYNGRKIVAGGRSMGGIISRYALAKSEQEGYPLPVKTWLTFDSPHQGAHISPELLDYFKDVINQPMSNRLYNNDAAKIMLYYNPFNDGSLRTEFYNELNSLNGDGYPHLTYNIGVAFSSNSFNPDSGVWLKVTFLNHLKFFSMQGLDIVPGSRIPEIELHPMRIGSLLTLFEAEQYKEPTFMPHFSALDLDGNGLSPFDETVDMTPGTFTQHSAFPNNQLTTPISNTVRVNQMTLAFQNVDIPGKADYRTAHTLLAGSSVRTDRANGPVSIDDEANIEFVSGQNILLDVGFSTQTGAAFVAYIESTDDVDCNSANGQSEAPQMAQSPESNSEIEANERLLEIFPNPANYDLTIKTTSDLPLSVFDSNGRLVQQINPLRSGRYTLNVAQWPNGLYILKQGEHHQRFLVQH